MNDLEQVRQRYREVNGDHPMTAEDDAYVRARFVALPDPGHTPGRMLAGDLPLPSYLLADGTPMVPGDYLEPVGWAGGVDRLRDWFLDNWPPDQQDPAAEAWEAYLSGHYVCLRTVTPVTIRRKAVLVAQAEAAVDVLATDPRDSAARGSLGEAVSKLDELTLPMTGYDRLRFGRPLFRETWVDGLRERFLTPADPPLPVHTDRLVLRAHEPADAERLFGYYSDPRVALHLLTPPLDRRGAEAEIRRRLSRHAGEGRPPILTLAIEHEGEMVGDLILMLQGPSCSQAEVGWVLDPRAAGRGIATEAARALVDLAFDHYGVHRVWAQLDARNERSAALCERLGMRRESHKLRDFWSKGEWTDSYEYAVLAEEWRRPS
jgi:RimJ/RimL family protein N-acetyltransferase